MEYNSSYKEQHCSIDYLYDGTVRIPLVVGNANNGSNIGCSCLNSNNGVSNTNPNNGSALTFCLNCSIQRKDFFLFIRTVEILICIVTTSSNHTNCRLSSDRYWTAI